MERTSNLLISKKDTVIFKRSLALLVGLNESIVLQQIHYWLEKKEEKGEHYFDGRYWVYNSYEGWQEQFPFWSVMTIRRAFSSLEKQGVLIVGNYNKAGFDKTKWYSIDFDALNKMNSASVQNEQTMSSKRTDGAVQNEQTNTIDYTETTTEIISKTSLQASSKENEEELLQASILKDNESTTVESNNNSDKFDWELFRNRISKSCEMQGHDGEFIKYVQHIFTYFYRHRKLHLGLEPQILNQQTIDKAVYNLFNQSVLLEKQGADVDSYEAMIDQYFSTDYPQAQNMDWGISHFLSGDIRDNLFYKTCY